MQRSTGLAVLSEIPRVPRKLDKALKAALLSEALLEVSRAFQLHFLRKGNTLVFLRRYTDPRELCSLEIEEITAITADLYRLVNGYAPGAGDYYGNITSTRDSNDFVKRFSPRQADAMQAAGGGLFDLKLYSNADELLTRQQPSWCVADPESGRFTLSGPLGPGLHPTLMFNVQRPDGKVDSWGWFVGSSSLE
jgi:hypothetical protein